MIEKFEGDYFDGQSSKKRACFVNLQRRGIELTFEDSSLLLTHDEVFSFEKRNNKCILQFGQSFPHPTLEVSHVNFYSSLQEVAIGEKYMRSSYNRFLSLGIKGIVAGLGLILLLLLGIYFFVIPAVMVGVASVFPIELEQKLGNQIYESYIEELEVDTAKTKAINAFYNQLDVDTKYEVNITVINSDVQNAFALPGGQIVVYSNIISNMENHESLVALLGHEVGHVEGRHTLKLMLKSLSNYLLLSAVFQDFSGMIAVIADNAMMVERLSFNREVESESDEFGYKVMLKNNVHPRGMINLFEQLQNESDSENSVVPEFLMTHPKLDQRIQTISEKINQAEQLASIENDSLLYYWNKIKHDRGN